MAKVRNGNKADALKLIYGVTEANNRAQRAMGTWERSAGHDGRSDLNVAARELRRLADALIEATV